MKPIKDMNLPELAAFVSDHLANRDIPVVLVGGGCVSIYSENRYQTNDLDVEAWAMREGMTGKFKDFLDRLGR